MTVRIVDHDIGVGVAGGGITVLENDLTEALKVDVSQLGNVMLLNSAANAEIQRYTGRLYGERRTKLTVEILGSGIVAAGGWWQPQPSRVDLLEHFDSGVWVSRTLPTPIAPNQYRLGAGWWRLTCQQGHPANEIPQAVREAALRIIACLYDMDPAAPPMALRTQGLAGMSGAAPLLSPYVTRHGRMTNS